MSRKKKTKSNKENNILKNEATSIMPTFLATASIQTVNTEVH